MTSSLDIKLLVVPDRLSMRERRLFQAGLEATNHSSTPIEPRLTDATLTIDGRRSAAWDRAIERGPCCPPWQTLSPEQRLSIWWSLGERVFDAPGRYQLVLRLGDRESIAEVEVTP